MFFALLFSLQLLILLNHFAKTNAIVSIKFTNMECNVLNTNVVLIPTCRIKAVKRNHYTASLTFKMIERPWHRIHGNLQIFTKTSDNRYVPWIYNITTDVCKFLKFRNIPFVTLLHDMIKDFTNFNHTCPYVEDIVVKDFYIDERRVPLPVPSGDYLVRVYFAFNNKPALIAKLFATITE